MRGMILKQKSWEVRAILFRYQVHYAEANLLGQFPLKRLSALRNIPKQTNILFPFQFRLHFI